ncbi:MAG TPA: methyltransferase domain-containing protein [Microthrixaceae bacterium]|nr:methyltransferase domain-containing protein [Microthrixaceae bacterium]
MATTDNTTQPRHHWPAVATELYLRDGERIEAINGPFGETMLDAVQLQAGERVLDVGCGVGTTTLDAARLVSPDGSAVGVDITADLLDVARHHAGAADMTNIEFLEADAQVHPFGDAEFDAIISRFGIMFFDDADAAFANIGRAVRPGGRLVTVCPGDPLDNQWVTIAFAAAAPHVGLPDLGPPGTPGPFAFADPNRLTRALHAGGFRDITVEPITRSARFGNDLDDVVDFITSLPESRQLFAGKPEEKIAAATGALREGFAPLAGPDGVVVGESAWLARASR